MWINSFILNQSTVFAFSSYKDFVLRDVIRYSRNWIGI